MRLAMIFFVLTVLAVPAYAQECELPADVVGRWQQDGCFNELVGCSFNPTREWCFRADGTWLERKGGATVRTGTWCVVPCPLPFGLCFPESGSLTLEIQPAQGLREGHFFSTGFDGATGRLETQLMYGEEVESPPIFEEDVEMWEYIGLPVKNEGSSWSAVKGMFR